MRFSPGLMQNLFQFTKIERLPLTVAQSAQDKPAPRIHAVAHRLSLLLSAWIGVSVITELLLQLTWPGLGRVMAYLCLGLTLIARYPLWTHSWFTDETPVSVHLSWLGIGAILALTGALAFPGHMLFFLTILAVEGHIVLSFVNHRWGRSWYILLAVLAACIHILAVGGEAGLIDALRAAPLVMAALIGLDLLVDAILPVAPTQAIDSKESTHREVSIQRYRNYVNRVEALAVAKERSRIAREFHDTLGHTLTTLDVQMELMARLPVSRIDEIQEAARQARTLVKDGLADVRRSIRALHPSALEGFSVVEAVQSLVDEFKRATQTQIQWRVEGKVSPLPPDLALPLYRAAQESLTNVRRHSGATEVEISLLFAGDMVRLVVEDNGRAQAPQRFGFGLSGIRDRVGELRGHFAAGPRPEGGFRLVVKLPK